MAKGRAGKEVPETQFRPERKATSVNAPPTIEKEVGEMSHEELLQYLREKYMKKSVVFSFG